MNQNGSDNKWKILATLSLGVMMATINTSIANVSLPTIGIYFNSNIGVTGLVLTAYFVTFIGLALLFSRAGDFYGHDTIFKYGTLGFSIVAVLCTIAPTIYILVLCRALQGIFAAMLLAGPMAILQEAFPTDYLGRAFGIYSVFAAVGLALGPTLGGVLQGLYSWRAIFLIGAPLGFITFLMAVYSLDKIETRTGFWDMKGVTFEFLTILFIIITVNFLESADYMLSLIFGIITIFLFLCFIKVEFNATDPVMNLKLFSNKTFSTANINLHLAYISEYVMLFALPYFLEKVSHESSMVTGLVLSSAPLMMIFFAPLSGWITDKKGTVLPTIAGTILCIISLICITTLNVKTSAIDVFIYFALYGIGCGLLQSPINKAIMVSVPDKYQGTASGIISTVRSLGISFGVCYGGLILSLSVSEIALKQELLYGMYAIELTNGIHYVAIFGIVLCIITIIFTIIGKPSKNDNI